MTLKRRWMWTIIGFVALGVGLELAVGGGLQFVSVRLGGRAWLRNEIHNSIPTYNAALFTQLRHESLQLGRRRDLVAAMQAGDVAALRTAVTAEDDAWLFLEGSTLSSSVDACAGDPLAAAALATSRDEAVIWCRGTPVMITRVPLKGAAAVFIALPLGQAYVETLKRLVGPEVELWGPHGAVVSTYVLSNGQHAPLGFSPEIVGELASRGERYGTFSGSLSAPYAGYRALDAEAQPSIEAGAMHFDVIALADVLDPARGPADLRIVASLPSALMTRGASMAALAMAFISALVVALTVLLARRLSAAFGRPLSALEKAAKEVAHGALGIELPISSIDPELASLAESFNAITARLADGMLRAVQQDKMAALGTLAGGVAHEINNPLAVILGFAQGLERRVGAADPLRLPITSIVREAQRCRNLVQEMLSFSHSGGQNKLEAVDFEAAVRSSLLLLDARARTQGVQVVPEVGSGLPWIQGSRTQLQQVLVNLGSNALDAMKQGGTLTVRVRADGPEIVLEVADTGSGIPPDIRTRIFEPFFTTKPVGEGTGLGLSLVYQIIKQYHGRIDVESQPGRGTLMRVALPAVRPEASA